MSKFQSLKVVEIIKETADCVSLVLEPISGGDFSFVAGQYLTLKAMIKVKKLFTQHCPEWSVKVALKYWRIIQHLCK